MTKHVSEKASKYLTESDVIAFKRIYVDIMGSITGALWLSQLAYWQPRAKRGDGYIYKSYVEWKEETGLSQYQVKKFADKALEMGVVEKKLARANGAPTLHYRINHKALCKVINSIIEKLDNQETSQSDYEETQQSDYQETSQSLTETTTETTPETTNTNWAELKKESVTRKKEHDKNKKDPVSEILKAHRENEPRQQMRERVETALRDRNLDWDSPRSPWNGYDKILIAREKETGETIEAFMQWYYEDDFRSKGDIYLKPSKIDDWWIRAFKTESSSLDKVLESMI